jgi:hypothetical protein
MAEDLQRASRTADIIAVLRLPVKINAILCLGMRSFKGMFIVVDLVSPLYV